MPVCECMGVPGENLMLAHLCFIWLETTICCQSAPLVQPMDIARFICRNAIPIMWAKTCEKQTSFKIFPSRIYGSLTSVSASASVWCIPWTLINRGSKDMLWIRGQNFANGLDFSLSSTAKKIRFFFIKCNHEPIKKIVDDSEYCKLFFKLVSSIPRFIPLQHCIQSKIVGIVTFRRIFLLANLKEKRCTFKTFKTGIACFWQTDLLRISPQYPSKATCH